MLAKNALSIKRGSVQGATSQRAVDTHSIYMRPVSGGSTCVFTSVPSSQQLQGDRLPLLLLPSMEKKTTTSTSPRTMFRPRCSHCPPRFMSVVRNHRQRTARIRAAILFPM